MVKSRVACLSVGVSTMWGAEAWYGSELERNSKWEQQRRPVGTEQRHSVSPVPIISLPHPPPLSSLRSDCHPIGRFWRLWCHSAVRFCVSQSRHVTEPKTRVGWADSTRPEGHRRTWWSEDKHETTDGERERWTGRKTARRSERSVDCKTVKRRAIIKDKARKKTNQWILMLQTIRKKLAQ